MLALLLTALAFGQSCPDVGDTLASAWAAFDDAELELALHRLDTATAALPCQSQLVETSAIVELFTLEGLVALAQQDRSLAIYSTIRIVTTDPDARPSDDLGPEFQELYATWSERLAASRIRLTWDGDGSAWVDGRPLPPGEPIEVIAGEHLIQVQRPDRWIGLATDIGADSTVRVVDGALVLGAPSTAPAPTPTPRPEPEPKAGGRKHRLGIVVGSGLAVAAGAAAIAYGYDREQRFGADPYDDPQYNGCTQGSPCYDAERARRIRSDATVVNGLYGGGYGLVGVGMVGLGLELFLLPEPAAGGGSVHVRVHW